MYADESTDSMGKPSARPAPAGQTSYSGPTESDHSRCTEIARSISIRSIGADDTAVVGVGRSGRNASRGRRAQGEPAGRCFSGMFEGRDTSAMPRAELARPNQTSPHR